MCEADRWTDLQAGVLVRNRAPHPPDLPGPVPTWLCSQPVQGAAGFARSSCSSASQRRISCLSCSFSTISRSRCFSKSVPPCRVTAKGGMWPGQMGRREERGTGRRACKGRGESGRGGEKDRRRKGKERRLRERRAKGLQREIQMKTAERARRAVLLAALHPFHSIFLSVKVTRKVTFIQSSHSYFTSAEEK